MNNMTNTVQHRVRTPRPQVEAILRSQGMHPLMARLMAARGVDSQAEAETKLADLIPPSQLKGIDQAAEILADALEAGARIVVVGDYDCDGATATAVGVRGLRMLLQSLGADEEAAKYHIDFLVPNRFEYGYGLSPEIVQLAAQQFEPDLLVTVDNGIASVEGVQEANELGIGVIVTDHHLPGEQLPQALAIVNPNQPDCTFPSKALAGVGVMFYLLIALRAEFRARGTFSAETQPRLENLLDLVALGTVADVASLDRNNRILVANGIKRIKSGQMQAGIRALYIAAGKDPNRASSFDLGFTLGPRLNAAGRLADMSLGIQCLLSESPEEALKLAHELDRMNRERRTIEAGMQETALASLVDIQVGDRPPCAWPMKHGIKA